MSKQIRNFQKCNGLTADGIVGPNTLQKMQVVFRICNIEQLAHFVGQVAHETANFSVSEENLNYSAKGLFTTFRKYFTAETASLYSRRPEAIANKVYANRMGNGDEASRDGWKYRGRGALQLTGKYNYEAFGNYLRNLQVLENPELVASSYYFQSALFFFQKNNLWQMCNQVNDASIASVTLRINGGYNGLEDRVEKTKFFYNKLR